MYEKYLIKDFNKQTWDCCHLASAFIKDNFNIDMSVTDNYPRDYEPVNAYQCMADGFSKNDFVETNTSFQKGDLLISKDTHSCWVCIDDKVAMSVRKIKHINKIKGHVKHLRHRSLL